MEFHLPRRLAPAIFFMLALALGGCTNLSEVREFAGESAKLTAYTGLVEYQRNTLQRQEPYLGPQALELERALDKMRREAEPDFFRLHAAATGYLKTLARLAGEDAFALDQELSGIGGNIKANPKLGIDAGTVDAYEKVVGKVAKFATRAAQQAAVRDMVQDGSADMDALLAGMEKVLGLFRRVSGNERKNVLGALQTGITLKSNAPGNELLVSLARAHLQERTAQYDAAERRYDEALAGLAAVREGNRELALHANDLGVDAVRQRLAGLRDRIRSIRGAISAAPA